MIYIMGFSDNEILLAKANRKMSKEYNSIYEFYEDDIIVNINWEFYNNDLNDGYYEENDETVIEFHILSEAQHELIISIFD